ncbi:TetR/AcrR family transcriptional regulator [Streptomyces griseorubiginosus]|uniref:TetR/AcrR family transcriptional regulator n=1 Tax=Streptomyces griseorubiginosus TaxID=67304 RepID=UPI001AD6A591|nr:TetR/AcrR family transcriptional regulator [Streptomyces griseorubiginosus]MBO4253285.1 TetR family transcriptional regulator [Streptomyces griseorubiginosus]
MTEEIRSVARRGPYAKTARRRAEIIGSATAVFSSRGYRGGSLREIAKQLDLSLTAVVHHFPSKSDLLVAVLENADFASGDSFETDSREKGVAHAVLRYVRRNLQRPEMLRLLALMAAESSAPDHPAHQWFRDRYERVVAGVASAIRRDQDMGRISNSRDHHEIAQSLVALWDGLQLQWLIDPRRDLAARMTAALEDLLGTRVPTERLPSSPG